MRALRGGSPVGEAHGHERQHDGDHGHRQREVHLPGRGGAGSGAHEEQDKLPCTDRADNTAGERNATLLQRLMASGSSLLPAPCAALPGTGYHEGAAEEPGRGRQDCSNEEAGSPDGGHVNRQPAYRCKGGRAHGKHDGAVAEEVHRGAHEGIDARRDEVRDGHQPVRHLQAHAVLALRTIAPHGSTTGQHADRHRHRNEVAGRRSAVQHRPPVPAYRLFDMVAIALALNLFPDSWAGGEALVRAAEDVSLHSISLTAAHLQLREQSRVSRRRAHHDDPRGHVVERQDGGVHHHAAARGTGQAAVRGCRLRGATRTGAQKLPHH